MTADRALGQTSRRSAESEWDVAVFLWCWIGLFAAVLLPLGIVMLRGWAPKRVRTRWSPARIRVQGVSALVLRMPELRPRLCPRPCWGCCLGIVPLGKVRARRPQQPTTVRTAWTPRTTSARLCQGRWQARRKLTAGGARSSARPGFARTAGRRDGTSRTASPMTVVVVIGLGVAVVQWLLDHWWILLLAALAATGLPIRSPRCRKGLRQPSPLQ